MKFADFLKKSFYLLAFFAILLAFLTLGNVLEQHVTAAWAGLAISFVNFLLGVAIISWGIDRPDKQFYSAFFGGMILRLALIFTVLFILIQFVGMHEQVLVVSLLLTYFSFLVLEIWDVNKFAAMRGK